MAQNTPAAISPAVRFAETASKQRHTPFAFGGMPQLPEGIPWPRAIHYKERDEGSLHFFAQINLPSLPRTMEHAGQLFGMPKFPRTGTIFIFLPLDGDSMYNTAECAVCYYPESVAHFPERTPPDDTPMIVDRRAPGDAETPFYQDSYVVRDNPEAVSDCGRYLKRVYAEAKTVLTVEQKPRKYPNVPHPGAPQMFGIADQGRQPDFAEDVLLFQLGCFAGVNFNSIDGDYWIWINKDELAEANFENARALMLTS